MNSFNITIDSNADVPEKYCLIHNIQCMALGFEIDGEIYDAQHKMDISEFYERMRKGAMPITSQVTPEIARRTFLKALEKSDQILHIGFSSALSGSCQSAEIAAKQICQEMPDKKIIVIDSLGASLGVGLLVDYAVKMRGCGNSLEDTAEWCEQHKMNVNHVFTVDNLFHLYRGGRVTHATAILGSAIGIKPIFHVDEKGKLVALDKVRGRKRSLIALVERMQNNMQQYPNADVFITHGDCLQDAEFVRDEIIRRIGDRRFLISTVGPTIGAHTGPGGVGIFFMGKMRQEKLNSV